MAQPPQPAPGGAPPNGAPAASPQEPPFDADEDPSAPDVRVARISALRATGDNDALIDRGDGQGYQKALVNLPVAAGDKLMTRSGFVELEFEDGRALRFAPYTIADIARMDVYSANGRPRTSLQLSRGVVYASLGAESGDFSIVAGAERLQIASNTRLRVILNDWSLQISVFYGHATLYWGQSALGITAGRTFVIGAGDSGNGYTRMVPYATPYIYDDWDAEMELYRMAGSGKASRRISLRYGERDLEHYGQYVDFGCGQMWRPYLAESNWQPYDNGYWVWRRRYGYTWVSGYPWGWTPYHSGYWEECNGYYGWRPGGEWRSQGYYWPSRPPVPLPTMTLKPKTPLTGVRYAKPKPPHPGKGVERVLTKPPVVSGLQGGRFVFRNGSAGLGVPKGIFTDKQLERYNSEMRRSGEVSVSNQNILRAWQVSVAPDGSERAVPPDSSMAGLDIIVVGKNKLQTIHVDDGPRDNKRLHAGVDVVASGAKPSAPPRGDGSTLGQRASAGLRERIDTRVGGATPQGNIRYFAPNTTDRRQIPSIPPPSVGSSGGGQSVSSNTGYNNGSSNSSGSSSTGSTISPSNSAAGASSSNAGGSSNSNMRPSGIERTR